MDMISDAFFFIRDKQWQGLKLDNITVVKNALDDLAGDDAFIGLRKRRALHRTLSLVEDRTAKFKQELADQDRQAEKEAKDELDKQKAALDADVEKIQNDDKLDRRTKMIQLMSAQTRRQQLMEQAEKDINEKKNRSKKQARTKFETEIRHIENRIRTWALLLLPLPVLLVGSYVFFSRMTEERQGANPERVRHNR